MEKTHQHRLFWNSEDGWKSSAEKATRRIDAFLKQKTFSESQNNLYEKDETNGQWKLVTNTDSLKGVNKGWVWYAWRTLIKNNRFIAFKGVSVLDQQIYETLLKNCSVYNENGEKTENPLEAGYIFLLTPTEATIFARNVQQNNGQIIQTSIVPEQAEDALSSIQLIVYEMEEIAAADRDALKKAKNNNFSAVLNEEFMLRGDKLKEKFSSAKEEFNVCQRSINALQSKDLSIEEKAQLQSILEQARAGLKDCDNIIEQRVIDETSYTTLFAEKQGLLKGIKPQSAKVLLFREVGLIASSEGLQVEDTPDGIRVLTEHGWLRLGPGFEFE